MEETHEEAVSRRRGRALGRIAAIVLTLAKERHSAMMAANHPDHNYDFLRCSDDVCQEAVRAHEEIDE